MTTAHLAQRYRINSSTQPAQVLGPLPDALPRSVRIQEVGLRDGLQLVPGVVPTKTKIALLDALSRAGLPAIQVTSFVRPDLVPQFSDRHEVSAGADRVPGVTYSALVPNITGARQAAEYGFNSWELMLSASESHSQANSGRSVEETLRRLQPVAALARERGVMLVGAIATALGCPFEGRLPYERVARIVGGLVDMGVEVMTLADTAGLADPRYVFELVSQLRGQFPDTLVRLHLHDTRGMGLANAVAGLAAGVEEFDASIAGLGGCPFVPGATGNIATEDLVHMLELMGVRTGVDLEALTELSRGLVRETVGSRVDSKLSSVAPSWVRTTPAPLRACSNAPSPASHVPSAHV